MLTIDENNLRESTSEALKVLIPYHDSISSANQKLYMLTGGGGQAMPCSYLQCARKLFNV
jgi:hypothetical protein